MVSGTDGQTGRNQSEQMAGMGGSGRGRGSMAAEKPGASSQVITWLSKLTLRMVDAGLNAGLVGLIRPYGPKLEHN